MSKASHHSPRHLTRRKFYPTKKTSRRQAGHIDGRNTDRNGRLKRRVPMSFCVVPLLKYGRTLDIWLVEYEIPGSKGVFQTVPWEVAISHGGIHARYLDGLLCPSDPCTYYVNLGWRVRYLAVGIKFGQAIIVDGGIHHAGHIGDGQNDRHALHISNDDTNEV